MHAPRCLLATIALAGCATTAPTPATVAEQPTPVARVERPGPDLATAPEFDARAQARTFDHAADCEQVARQLKERAPERGWQLLRACIERGDFTELRALLDGGWDRELHQRTDAAALLARLVAQRGGDIDADLALLHERHIPVFTLADVSAQPETYAGRLLLLRARVSDQRRQGGDVTVRLAEYQHGSRLVDAQVGPARERIRKVSHVERAPSGTEHHETRTHDREMETEKRFQATDQETGREALGKLHATDPFLEPEKDFIILARFDGVRVQDDAEDGDEPLPVVTVLQYFRPSAFPVY